jgi:hypothetical protein
MSADPVARSCNQRSADLEENQNNIQTGMIAATIITNTDDNSLQGHPDEKIQASKGQ